VLPTARVHRCVRVAVELHQATDVASNEMFLSSDWWATGLQLYRWQTKRKVIMETTNDYKSPIQAVVRDEISLETAIELHIDDPSIDVNDICAALTNPFLIRYVLLN
jgi:hypothetical protein